MGAYWLSAVMGMGGREGRCSGGGGGGSDMADIVGHGGTFKRANV